MKRTIALAGLAACLLPMTVWAAPKTMHKKTAVRKAAAATMYECSKCHMKYTAAQARKNHFIDPMDGGKLVPVKPAAGKKG